MAWRQSIIWSNDGKFTDAYMRHWALVSKNYYGMLGWFFYIQPYDCISKKNSNKKAVWRLNIYS